jgi:tetratricopeptide (TPR) repeat protein
LQSLLKLPSGNDTKTRERVAEQTMSEGVLNPDQAMFLYDLLDLPQLDDHRIIYEAMDNQGRIRGKHDTVLALLGHYSQAQPLMIVVEDLHWADQLTLAYMARISERAGRAAILLIMTSRVESDPLNHAWYQSKGRAVLITMDLAPLAEEEALALASEFFDLTDRFAIECVQRAEGNPLFLEQLLRSAQSLGKEKVPGSIRSIVLARVDCLESQDKRGLQAAAVLGQRFSLKVLRYLIEDPVWEGDVLVTHHLVRPLEDEYMFSHALIWESVYSTLLQEQLQSLHRRAANWFSTRDLGLKAVHLKHAGSSAAATAYLEAAIEQCRSYHFERAREFAEKGMIIVRDRGERHELQMCLGQCLVELGQPAESIQIYQQALESATTDVARCRAWIGLAAGMRITDDYDQALEILDKAESTASGDPRLYNERSQIHHCRGNLFFPLGNIEGCLQQHQLALQFARQASSGENEVRALGGLGDAHYANGQMAKALDHFLQCVKQSDESGFERIAVNNRYMVAWTQLYMKQVETSLEGARRAVESAARAGQPRAEMVAGAGGTRARTRDRRLSRGESIQAVLSDFHQPSTGCRFWGRRHYDRKSGSLHRAFP